MGRRGVRITLLVEDSLIERFARHVLLQLGFARHEIRVVLYPVGRGSAKQWIETRYPVEVTAYRRRARHQQVCLLVGTDADQVAVETRFQQLADTLQQEAQQPRAPGERIVVWIPKWSIETWIRFLAGEEVDEDARYRLAPGQADIVSVCREFVRRYRQWAENGDPGALSSLIRAYEETARLEAP